VQTAVLFGQVRLVAEGTRGGEQESATSANSAPLRLARPVVFLDRDGTINPDKGYMNHPDLMELYPGAAAAIRRMQEAGLAVVVTTNQAGIAKGFLSEDTLGHIHARMEELLAAEGVRLDGLYYCPHSPRDGNPPYRKECDCRKPAVGMAEKASADLGLDLSRSYVVGDKRTDVEFGRNVGAATILVLTGYGRGEWAFNRDVFPSPDHVAQDLATAADWIIEHYRSRRSSR
jgi:D-glycero-D-manno-heptose 1,7-bisphosphate phosphatase